jgi:hypothetical protein
MPPTFTPTFNPAVSEFQRTVVIKTVVIHTSIRASLIDGFSIVVFVGAPTRIFVVDLAAFNKGLRVAAAVRWVRDVVFFGPPIAGGMAGTIFGAVVATECPVLSSCASGTGLAIHGRSSGVASPFVEDRLWRLQSGRHSPTVFDQQRRRSDPNVASKIPSRRTGSISSSPLQRHSRRQFCVNVGPALSIAEKSHHAASASTFLPVMA